MKKTSLRFSRVSEITILVFGLFLIHGCSASKSSTPAAPTPPSTDNACASLQPTALRTLTLSEKNTEFFDQALSRIRDLVPPPIESNVIVDSYIEGGGARHVNFNFSLDGINLCQFSARLHSLADRTYIEGRLPKNFTSTVVPEVLEADGTEVTRIMKQLDLAGDVTDVVRHPCLVLSDDRTLTAGMEVNFSVKGLPYYGLVTQDSVVKAESRFFDATTEQSKIYIKQPTASTKVVFSTVTLQGMSDGGSLCSARFKTVVPDFVTKAFATDGAFIFPITDQRFKETSIFTNGTIHSNWFLSLGILKTWPGPKVDIFMDGTNNFLNNTSVYLPKSGTTPPQIRVGSGDGIILQNLYLDYDVVSHELGHHIVYRTLTTTIGESLVLHEGLADFFVFADTKDPCLGRLICPAGGTLCYSTQCLRTGQFPLNFGDDRLPTEAHKLSQVISSMLWDLANGNSKSGVTGIGVDTAAKITLKGVDFLPSDSGYTGLIRSLMQADKALNNSQNCAAIEAVANARGLKDDLANDNVSCTTVP